MKLSDFKNEDALDLLANIIDPATELLADEKFKKIFQTGNKLKAVKYVLQNHKKSVLEILAAMQGVDVKDYKANVIEMIKSLLEILNDENLMAVFTSQSQTMDGESFGSAMENTEETEIQ